MPSSNSVKGRGGGNSPIPLMSSLTSPQGPVLLLQSSGHRFSMFHEEFCSPPPKECHGLTCGCQPKSVQVKRGYT